jgi:hypothetical protein
MKYHYTYEITYPNGMKYIGVRSCTCPPSEDNYYGSSKHTPTTGDKLILRIFKTRKEAVQHEVYLHNYNDVARNPIYYNKAKQTSTGFDTSGMLMGAIRNYEVSEATKQKLREHNLGKKQSPETKAKRSASLTGKKRTDTEFYKRLGEANRKRLTGTKKTDEYIFNSEVKDKTIRIFYNKNTEITEVTTTWELLKKYDLNKSHAYQLVKGGRKTHKGWTYIGEQT